MLDSLDTASAVHPNLNEFHQQASLETLLSRKREPGMQTNNRTQSFKRNTNRQRQREGPTGRPDFGGKITSALNLLLFGHPLWLQRRGAPGRKIRRIYGGWKEALLHKRAGKSESVTLWGGELRPPQQFESVWVWKTGLTQCKSSI